MCWCHCTTGKMRDEDELPSDSGETRYLLNNNGERKLSSHYKVLRICTLFWLWLCFGVFSEITGPVLPELIIQTNSQYEVLAQCMSMRGAGHALGGIIGGLTVDRWFHHIDILISVILIFYTTVSVGAAYVQNVVFLYVVFFIQGSIETWLQTAGYRIALKTWKEKSAGPLHALHMGYGLGSVIAPQLVAPFLDPRFSSGVIQTGYNSSCRANKTIEDETTTPKSTFYTDIHSYDTRDTTPKYPANFVTAYWILSGLSLTISAIFFLYHIYGRVSGIRLDENDARLRRTQELNFRSSFSPKSCSPTKPVYAGLIVGTLFFYYLISVPLVRAFSKFIFSYARDGPCLSVTESTSLESAYFAALTIGRLCAFLTSSILHIKYLLQVEVLGVLVSTLVLLLRYDNITILWIFCSTLGFFTGPIIPTAFAWANRYIEVTSVAQIVPQIGAAVGDVAFLFAVGYSYQNFGPYIIWSYQLALGSAICLIAVILQIFGSLHGDRYHNT